MRTQSREPRTVYRLRRRSIAAPVMLLLAFLSSWFLVLPHVSAQIQPPDLPTYSGWVREAFAAAQRNDRFGLEQAAERLTGASSVRLPNSQSVPVDNGWLHEALASGEPDFPAIAARLGAILDALTQPDSSAPADARERLHALLSQPPFSEAQRSDTGWWRQFWSWVGRLLESLLRPVGRVVQPGSEALGWVFLAIGAVLLAGILGYVVLGLRRTIAAEARTADDDPAAGLTARSALDQAGQIARGGDYRSATRYMYLSALLWLDERELLRYDRALTNREYLERLRDNTPLREQLRPVVETFDRVWYGHATVDAASFAAYRAQVEALRREAS